jgi:2-polyprenyl-3-methyl-5-hydroxy-6-metoxy-1,4-benzoquinol methylase
MSIPPALHGLTVAPSIPTVPVEDCPTCHSTGFSPFASGFDYEIETCRNEWTLHQCVYCTTVVLSPRPTDEALPVIYPSNYYSYGMSTTLHPLILRGKSWLDTQKIRSIARHLRGRMDSYLDIGCGDGRYLHTIEGLFGLERKCIKGLELDSACVARLVAKEFDVRANRVEELAADAFQDLSLITMFHVIEHVADPKEVLMRAAGWLGDNGVIAVETPNIDSLDARMFKRTYWGGYHFPRHWTLFSTRSIERLFEASGLEIVATSYQTGHSFWLYSFHHWLRYQLDMPSLARWFDPMRSKMMLIAVTGFDKLRALLGFKTSAILVLGRKRRSRNSS